METKDRNIGIDLLRIISMIMVVTHHYLGHGGVLDQVNDLSFNWFFVWAIRSICYMSVTIFFLISAFFQSEKPLGLKSIIRIWIEVLFYSILGYCISIIVGWNSFSLQGLCKAVFPVMFRQYGFFNGYLLLALLSKYINSGINHLTQKEHVRLIAILTTMVCVIPCISHIDAFNLSYGEGVLWLLLIYISAAYIRKYKVIGGSSIKMVCIGLVLCLIQFVIKALIGFVSNSIWGSVKYSNAFFGETPLICFFASCCVFIGFKNMRIKSNIVTKGVGICTPLVFSVFLLHENNNLKYHIWEILNPGALANELVFKLILHWLIVVFVIFIISFLIEYFRRLFDKALRITDFVASSIYNCRLRSLLCTLEDKFINGNNEGTK